MYNILIYPKIYISSLVLTHSHQAWKRLLTIPFVLFIYISIYFAHTLTFEVFKVFLGRVLILYNSCFNKTNNLYGAIWIINDWYWCIRILFFPVCRSDSVMRGLIHTASFMIR